MLSRRSIRLRGKWKSYIFVVFIPALLLGADSSPLAESTQPQVLRSRAYRLNLAGNKDVKVLLQSLQLGTRIDLLPQNGLILTAGDNEDLIKASSLIQLIDSRQKYVVKVLADFSDGDVLPAARRIIEVAGVSAVGTFAEPPAGKEPGRIILDVHDSRIVVVAPAELLSRVAAAVSESMAAGKADSTAPDDTEQPTQAAVDEASEPQAKTESMPAKAAVEAEPGKLAVPETQTPQAADVKAEATKETADGGDHKPEEFFQAQMFDSLAEAEINAGDAANELLAAATPSKETAEAEVGAPPAEAETEVAPVNIEPQDFFQAEMFKSLAEAEAKAEAAMAEITQAERSANEALARAIKAEQLAREKQRLAAEAARLAAETKKKAAEAQKALPPEEPPRAKTPTQAAAVAQQPKPQPKAKVTNKTQPKPVARTEDKAPPRVDPNAPGEGKPPVDPAGDDAMLEALKKLAAKAAVEKTKADAEIDGAQAEAGEDKVKTAVAEKVVPPVPPVRPVPKPSTSRTPPGVTAADKIATEAPSKIEPTLPDADKEVQTTMMLPEKVEITALIELVGKQLGLNYMYDTKLVTGEVFLKIHDGRINVKDMYALLESVLQFKGFVMARRGNLVTVMKSTDAAKLDSVIRRDSDDIQPGDINVTTVFKLEHISTATAQAMLQNMKLGLLFNPIEETKTLIVTGYAYRMARMEEMLKMVDVPGKERKFRSRKLEYLLPSELAEKAKALAEQLGTISITVSKQPVKAPTRPTSIRPTPTRTPTRTPTPSRTAAPPKAAADKGVYLDTDDRTNRVLMIGLEDDLETVDMLIDSLDVAKYGLKSVKEYEMQFVEATEIVNTLAELGVITSAPRSTTTSRTPTTRTPTTRTPTTRTPTTRTPTSYGAARPVEGEPQISIRLTTNSLLINATPEQHAEIEMLIRFVDVEQKDIRTVQEYEIQYVDITEVVDTLAELGIVEQRSSSASSGRAGGLTSRSSRLPTGARTPATTGSATPQTPSTTTFEATTGAEITSQQPQIAVLESTNSLLVYATPKQHDTISLIVAHVDRELTEISTPYVVYALENQDPEELAATLNEIIQATVKEAAKSPTSKVQTATTTATIPPKREKNEIQIVADVKSYSLIVYADKKNQQWISALIEELDAYRPQVHLDVTLVAITQDDQFNYDLDLVTKLPNMALGGSMESGGLVTALVEPFIGSAFEASVSDGSGIAFYSDKHVQTLLDLLDKKNYGRVLARPSLLVKDNQLGEIKAERTIYVAQEKSSIVPTTSDTSQTVTDVTFQDYTSGVTLSITPHIASDKILQLEIMLDRTDFVPDTGTTVIRGETFPKPLDTNASNLATWAVLPNGATIILGGIESITQSKTIRKVPLLGDLPILGALFRGVDETDVQSKLYVFVKATIIRPGEELTGVSDIEAISRKKRDAFEEDEVKFQRLEGVIPGVTPPPLDPIRILEDDEYIRELKKKLHKDEKVSVEVKLDDAY